MKRIGAFGALALTLVVTAALALGPIPRASGQTVTDTIFGLTADNQLVTFGADDPDTLDDTSAITGLQDGETLLGIDVRPNTGGLYGLGSTSRLYTIDPATGAATAVGAEAFDPPLAGTAFGFDVNPAGDRIRVVSDTGQNLRLHPDTGATVDTNATMPGNQVDPALAFAEGDDNEAATPAVTGAAYNENTASATASTLFDIDSGLDALVRQGSPGGQPKSPNSGELATIGALGIDTGPEVGFDITPGGVLLASLTPPTATQSSLYTVNAQTGTATSIGAIGGSKLLDIAVDLPDPVVRLAGANRIATAVAASKNNWIDGGADAVVLARADSFADALAGTPLAVAKNGPLLLTASDELSPDTRTEIQRVLGGPPEGPTKTVYLLGGTAALSQDIQAELLTLGYPNVTRYGGGNRFETAVQIATQGLEEPETVLLATGITFADALAGGAAAAKVEGAILLTNGAEMAPATQAYLDDHTGGTRYALGGPAAAADPGAQPLVGTDRYDTSVKVAQQFFADPFETVGFATGADFPDGLSGGAHIGTRGGPVLLVALGEIPATVATYIGGEKADVTLGYVYGGTAVVSEGVRQALQNAIT